MALLMNTATIPDLLRRLVAARSPLSERQVAKEMKVSATAFNRWINGFGTPDPQFCWKIADALGLDEVDVLRAAGHLRPRPDDSTTEAVFIVPELSVRLRVFTPQEQRDVAIPAIRVAEQILRERRAEYGQDPPEPEGPRNPADDSAPRRPGPSQP